MHLALVGAGPAGLAAARALLDAAPTSRVALFEKSRGVGGRAATRRRETAEGTWRFDHGAQYAAPPGGSPAHRLLTEGVPTDGLVRLEGRVWPFDGDGTLRPDLARDDGAPRLTYADGMSGLGRRLAADLAARHPGRCTLHLATRVGRLAREHGGWGVYDEAGSDLSTSGEPFDAVLLTPPAPQAADLVAASDLDAAVRDELAGALRAVPYRSQFAVTLAFPAVLARPGEFYALVCPSGGHAVAWVAYESDKPGRAPDGHTLVVAQMSPGWTRERYDAATEEVAAEALSACAPLLGGLPEPLWADVQRWRYALPDAAVRADALARAEGVGLFVAGDGVAGQGRVHLALESGLSVGARVAAWAAAR